jgi:hypothetical protein
MSDNFQLSCSVRRLKIQLRKFAKIQAKFEEKLDKPVQTTVSVEPGEPGLMGRRGPRGSLGPQYVYLLLSVFNLPLLY